VVPRCTLTWFSSPHTGTQCSPPRTLARTQETTRAARADCETELAELSGEANHAHLLVNFPPESCSAQTGQQPQRRITPPAPPGVPELVRHYWLANRLWSGSYFAGSAGGPPIAASTTTLSSRTTRCDPRPGTSAFTIGLKVGALADILVAMAFIVVYDANVLVGNTERDLLIRIARSGLAQEKWTDQILDEAMAALQKSRPTIPVEKIRRLRELMIEAVEDCMISGYEPLIDPAVA
jgi:REP element-mobilizing transposase RayT